LIELPLFFLTGVGQILFHGTLASWEMLQAA
jgi:hypothetical protein